MNLEELSRKSISFTRAELLWMLAYTTLVDAKEDLETELAMADELSPDSLTRLTLKQRAKQLLERTLVEAIEGGDHDEFNEQISDEDARRATTFDAQIEVIMDLVFRKHTHLNKVSVDLR